jgi:hypothetical protein
LSGLSNVLRHQLKRKDEEATRRKVEELFSRLMPETLEQKILFYVKNAMYDFSPPEKMTIKMTSQRMNVEQLI